MAGLGIETYQPILFGERQNLRDDFLGLFRHDGHDHMPIRHFHAAGPGAVIQFLFRKRVDFGVEADQTGAESLDLVIETALRSHVFQQLVLVGGFLIVVNIR